jgi:hypothetical protein
MHPPRTRNSSIHHQCKPGTDYTYLQVNPASGERKDRKGRGKRREERNEQEEQQGFCYITENRTGGDRDAIERQRSREERNTTETTPPMPAYAPTSRTGIISLVSSLFSHTNKIPREWGIQFRTGYKKLRYVRCNQKRWRPY